MNYSDKYQFSIFYTTDLHGNLGNWNNNKSISNIANYILECKNDYIVLDNGDNLQGSPLNDIWINSDQKEKPLISEIFNKLNYKFINIGNHDFNYGLQTLINYTKHLNGTVLCANCLYNNELLFKPYEIITLKNGFKLGFIGLVTQYIPNWEKPENIKNITFLDAFETAKKYLEIIKNKVDLSIILYHGGYEADPVTGVLNSNTNENEGYKIAKHLNADILLCGHQHSFQQPIYINDTLTMLPGSHANCLGKINISFTKENNVISKHITAYNLLPSPNSSPLIDEISEKYVQKVKHINNQKLCHLTNGNLLIEDQFKARLNNHLLFSLMGDALKNYIDCDVFVMSLFNNSKGLEENVTYKNIVENFPYPNNFVVIEIKVSDLLKEMNHSASYFTLQNDNIVINNSFIYPKIEHYNYDVFYGLEYTILVSEKETKVESLKYHNKYLSEDETIKICLNNYRASGGGEYHNYPKAKVIKKYDISIQEIIKDYLLNNPELLIENKIKCKIIK